MSDYISLPSGIGICQILDVVYPKPGKSTADRPKTVVGHSRTNQVIAGKKTGCPTVSIQKRIQTVSTILPYNAFQRVRPEHFSIKLPWRHHNLRAARVRPGDSTKTESSNYLLEYQKKHSLPTSNFENVCHGDFCAWYKRDWQPVPRDVETEQKSALSCSFRDSG